MKSSMTSFTYALIVVAVAGFCSSAEAQQTDGKTGKTTVKTTVKTEQGDKASVDSKGKKAEAKEEKPFETWGSEANPDSGGETKPETKPKLKTKPTVTPEAKQAETKQAETKPENPSSKPGSVPPPPPRAMAPHPMDAHEHEMNRSMPKPPPPVRAEPKAITGYDKSQDVPEASPKRFKRYDIGVATGFGAGATDLFSRSTSVIWKVSGEFFFDHVGISPFILADKGRELGGGGLTFFVSFGVQLKYRFFTDKVFQPYVSGGAAVAINSGKLYEDSTAGPVAGLGALIKLNDIFYLHFDSFVLFPLDSKTSDESKQYIELGDLLFVATLGAAVLF